MFTSKRQFHSSRDTQSSLFRKLCWLGLGPLSSSILKGCMCNNHCKDLPPLDQPQLPNDHMCMSIIVYITMNVMEWQGGGRSSDRQQLDIFGFALSGQVQVQSINRWCGLLLEKSWRHDIGFGSGYDNQLIYRHHRMWRVLWLNNNHLIWIIQ